MCDKSMWDINFESFFTILQTKTIELHIPNQLSPHTSKHVRIPGHVVTTDALQRLCITHVQTRSE